MFLRRIALAGLISFAPSMTQRVLAQAVSTELRPGDKIESPAAEAAQSPAATPAASESAPPTEAPASDAQTAQAPAAQGAPDSATDANASPAPAEASVAPTEATDSEGPGAAASQPPHTTRIRELTLRSAEAEREIENLTARRNQIRLVGLAYARAVTWGLASAFALGSLATFGSAQSVERDLSDGKRASGNDTDRDGDVDADDERHSRSMSRTMGGVSLIMATGGVLSSVFYRKQLREQQALDTEIQTWRNQEKRSIFELDYELRASRREARLALIIRM